MKIIFFGSTNLALPILESLHKHHDIAAVVTTPDAKSGRKQILEETPVSSLAKDLDLQLLKPEDPKADKEFLTRLKKINADIFVLEAYGKILPLEIINLPKYKILNMHPSLLPKYRGPSPIKTALLNGDEYTGVTFILLDEQIDHGPMLDQKVVKIGPDDNDFTLTDKLAHIGASMINKLISDYISGKLIALPQDESQATYTKIISKADGKIDWTKSAQQIYNQFRAFYPWPGIWTTWKGVSLKITDCVGTELQKRDTTDDYRNGTVINGGVVVCGSQSALKINRLQLAGKNETSISEFLNGYRDFVGSVLK